MQDLNDLAYFAAVADHGGFAPASRVLGLPKSKLSRRVALLEARLGVRLLHRTTRRFAITETGAAFLRHCHAMLAEAQAAEALVAEQSGAPRGTVRLACPPALLHAAVGDMLAHLLNAWPQISLQVQATNRPVDVWEGGVDLALRVRTPGTLLPAEETVKPLALSPHLLVAAPALLTSAAPPATPHDLLHLPTLGMGALPDDAVWTLHGPDGETVTLPHRPRLMVDDMAALLCAARAGVGCAVLPRLLAFEALARGDLLELLPGWAPPAGQVQAAFATRRGMRHAVRQVLDALAAGFEQMARQGRCLAWPASPPTPARAWASPAR
ncbi:MAG: LysR substrate-binding domain-containing protein [Comamonadaceae bacterium]|nr:LysR substrate-binding domain-containing protein [Comamonadaceae bacterium]